MAVVVLDIPEFRGRFPRFTPEVAPDGVIQQAFDEAALVLDNSDLSPVPYDPDAGRNDRKVILYTLTCHLLTLALQAAQGQPGPVASVSEGSVSVSFAAPPLTGKAADFYQQTQCGQVFWQYIRRFLAGGLYVTYKDGPHHG